MAESGRLRKRRFGKNMAADVSAKKNAGTSQAKINCRNVSYDMWGISGVCMLALTAAKTSSQYDRFPISAPARHTPHMPHIMIFPGVDIFIP